LCPEVEEERLQVDESINRQACYEVVDVLAEVVEVLILYANKLFSKEFSRVFSGGAFLGEYTIA
jgi:hypothetical protein